MCSIMGYTGKDISKKEFLEGFEKTITRGPDMSRVIEAGSGIMAFHRLAIMDLEETGMQPFERDGDHAICNGEIYGFRGLKKDLESKGYKFSSDSDCEIILPLYREYGVEMFRMLDAEFAMIIHDGSTDSYIAARDPIGIRPLYFGYTKTGKIIFASEAKNLTELTEKVMPFPPGHYYKDGSFHCYMDLTKVDTVCDDPVDVICKTIKQKLISGIAKRLDSDAPMGFLLSGGLTVHWSVQLHRN
ncbi:MAG: hypothetical protein V8Q42_07850 [Anaerovoracaceae bacterium]